MDETKEKIKDLTVQDILAWIKLNCDDHSAMKRINSSTYAFMIMNEEE